MFIHILSIISEINDLQSSMDRAELKNCKYQVEILPVNETLMVSDFEVLMKSSHGHNGPNGPERDEFNNHKDYNQEKPFKLKQR